MAAHSDEIDYEAETPRSLLLGKCLLGPFMLIGGLGIMFIQANKTHGLDDWWRILGFMLSYPITATGLRILSGCRIELKRRRGETRL